MRAELFSDRISAWVRALENVLLVVTEAEAEAEALKRELERRARVEISCIVGVL